MIATTSPTPESSFVDVLNSYLAGRSLSASSVSAMRLTVQSFQNWLGDPLPVREVTDDLVNCWLLSMEQRGLAPITIRNRRVIALTIWRFAFELGIVKELPRRVRKIKVPLRIPKAWSAEQFTGLYAAAGKLTGEWRFRPVSHADYWQAWLLTQYESGLRFGDMLRITREQVASNGTVAMLQQKSGWPIRFRLRPETIAAIYRIAPDGLETPVFSVASRRRIFTGFARLLKAAGLKGGTHTIRKTSATMLESKHPGSAMAHLGHKTPGLAYQSYVDPVLVQRAKPLAPPLPGVGGQQDELPDEAPPNVERCTLPPVEALEPSPASPARRTLEQVVEAYAADAHPTDAHLRELLTVIASLRLSRRMLFSKGMPAYADMLTDAFLLRWLAWLSKRHSPSTVVRYRRMLVKLWAFAHARKWATVDPFANRVWKFPGRPDQCKQRPKRRGVEVPAAPGELRFFLRTIFQKEKLAGGSPLTLRLYECTCNNLWRFLGREALLTDLTNQSATEFLRWYANRATRGKLSSPKSVAKERSNLLALWNHAARKRLVEDFPAVPTVPSSFDSKGGAA